MKRVFPQKPALRSRQIGLSLVELIVAMVIGLTVVSAALAMYVNSGFSGRGSSALSQMTEDASIALSLLRSQVAMAGYGKATAVASDGSLQKGYNGAGIFGCKGGPTDATYGSGTPLANMACNNDDSKPDSIVVLYEADTKNTVPTSGPPALATDCLGNGLSAPAGGGPVVAENRYYVKDNTLSCLGNGSTTSQPLVENIKQLKILYGIAGTGSSRVAQRYMTAEQVAGSTPQASNSPTWKQVTSVRICVLIQSEKAVLDTPAGYVDCNGSDQPESHFLYRAFTTTVVLQNRIL